MVLVSVGENKSAEFSLVAGQVGEIGYYEVNTGHIVLGKGNAAVYCDNIVAVLEERHIHADPVNTANGYYLKLCALFGLFLLFYLYLLCLYGCLLFLFNSFFFFLFSHYLSFL